MPNTMMFSRTVSQIFFVDFIVSTTSKRKTKYRFTDHITSFIVFFERHKLTNTDFVNLMK